MLRDCIDSRFAQTKQMEELFEAEQPELDQMQEAVEDWKKELHILTSQDTIGQWETEYCLDHNTALTLEQRRARAFAKKSERFLPRKEDVEQAMKAMLNAKRVTIYESDCKFEISVETVLLVDNMEIARQYFRQIRPAHFEFDFVNEIRREHKMSVYLGIAEITEKEFTGEVEL